MKLLSNSYLVSIILTAVGLPALLSLIHLLTLPTHDYFSIYETWFVFSAIGLRLFLAGCKQMLDPEFTLKKIFHINNPESAHLVQELGANNVCIGIIGLLSPLVPSFANGALALGFLYFMWAGFLHITKKPKTLNQQVALLSDFFIALVSALLLISKFIHYYQFGL